MSKLRKRVLHVIPSVAASDGGPAQAVRRMAALVAARDLEVDVATTNDHCPRRSRPTPGIPVVEGGVRYFSFPRQILPLWKCSPLLVHWLLRNVERYDLLHVHALFSFPTTAAASVARRCGKPYILRPLGTLDPETFASKQWKKRPYYHLIERVNLAGSAAIHATSLLEREALASFGFGPKTFVIPQSVAQQCCPKRCYRNGVRLKLLFLSRLQPIKGLSTLLEALNILNNFQPRPVLVVAGDGDPSYRANVQQQIQRLHLEERVRLTGWLSDPEKRCAFEDADLFVLPSYHENFGLAAAEALASGLPAIVTERVGLAPDIVRAQAGMVVPVNNPEALADAIRVMAEARVRMTAGKNAYDLAREMYAPEREADRLCSLYEQVAN